MMSEGVKDGLLVLVILCLLALFLLATDPQSIRDWTDACGSPHTWQCL